MDFRRELEAILVQVPHGEAVRCGDVARALGDVRASAAVFRFLREHPDVSGGHRVVTERGRPTSPAAARALRAEGWTTAQPPFEVALRPDAPLALLRAEQRRLARRVSRVNGFRALHTIGGVDVSYEGDDGYAALVVLRASDLAVVEEVFVSRPVHFPYIPTYLAYRELPLIRAAFERLTEPPTILLIDGHGTLHPMRCGLACMVGLTLDIPTLGVAKNPLMGTIPRRPRVGEAVPVRHGREVLGYAVRTSASIKPLYVSVGHRVALRTAVRIVRTLCVHRHPEPLRLADRLAADMKRRQRKRHEERSGLAPTPRADYRKRSRSD